MKMTGLAFIGPIGGAEMLVLMFVFAVVVVGLILWSLTRRPQPPGGNASILPPNLRLKELESLRKANLITEEEFSEKRSKILSDL